MRRREASTIAETSATGHTHLDVRLELAQLPGLIRLIRPKLGFASSIWRACSAEIGSTSTSRSVPALDLPARARAAPCARSTTYESPLDHHSVRSIIGWLRDNARPHPSGSVREFGPTMVRIRLAAAFPYHGQCCVNLRLTPTMTRSGEPSSCKCDIDRAQILSRIQGGRGHGTAIELLAESLCTTSVLACAPNPHALTIEASRRLGVHPCALGLERRGTPECRMSHGLRVSSGACSRVLREVLSRACRSRQAQLLDSRSIGLSAVRMSAH